MNRRPYPSDVSDEEWEFVAPYLSLLSQTAAQRRHELREGFNAVRSIVRTGAPWRWLPTNLPPWEAVYQQTRRLIAAHREGDLSQPVTQAIRVLGLWGGNAREPLSEDATRADTCFAEEAS
jgi:transposase